MTFDGWCFVLLSLWLILVTGEYGEWTKNGEDL